MCCCQLIWHVGGEWEKKPHLGFFLKLVGDGPEYDHCSFVIDKVALIPWTPRQGWANVMTGFCLLPEGKMLPLYEQESDYFSCTPGTFPPGFDLRHYITHVNRGITHFHGSFWPLSRRLSDSAFEAAEPPPEWIRYMLRHSQGFYMVGEMFSVVKRDGTLVPLFKYDSTVSGASFYDRPAALAKVDSTEFKKLLDNPSRRLYIVPIKRSKFSVRLRFTTTEVNSEALDSRAEFLFQSPVAPPDSNRPERITYAGASVWPGHWRGLQITALWDEYIVKILTYSTWAHRDDTIAAIAGSMAVHDKKVQRKEYHTGRIGCRPRNHHYNRRNAVALKATTRLSN
ncbi:hypothetical protein B0H17DRAFT_1148024 [Mycena rosella]|uniref:Uncharacterized protein n=1 Tax=Mycena rosella TaxID=1033263 RepID=A0AAD7CH67_MYCRO|nr:hypothetical protein B0H17DRAFT_1148024 [Mycena rosella]